MPVTMAGHGNEVRALALGRANNGVDRLAVLDKVPDPEAVTRQRVGDGLQVPLGLGHLVFSRISGMVVGHSKQDDLAAEGAGQGSHVREHGLVDR